MKRIFALIVLCALLTGCAAAPQAEQTQYTATFLTLFDTVTTIIGRAEDEAAFQAKVQPVHDALQYYHELFDIYNDYEGVNNIKTINDNAGVAPVAVDKAIIDLLTDCKAYYALSGGRVNVMMGSVLRLWHEARNDGLNDPANAKLPDQNALLEAANHISMDALVIDETASTVYLSDPQASLDVGAVAKGWATQRAVEAAAEGMLISVGGNVCATGPKKADGTPWVIGIQNPDVSDENIHTLFVSFGSVVTSGDYQRAYVVDGKAYHHIIDPDTLMPAAYWRSVSIVCGDSGLADALSTALFLMDAESGEALAKEWGADAYWIAADGSEYMTDGFEKMLRT